MRFIELFAGIGGFRAGLERCIGTECTNEKSRQTKSEIQFRGERTTLEKERGILSTDKRRGRSVYRCAWANEIDKYACQIYRKNFGEGELYEGDIRQVDAKTIPDHELLVGGFPCQAFSVAGKRGGFDDTRGTLFFEIARILNVKRPECVLLENVKGLLSHDSGKTFQTILKVLSDIGYRVEWQVLNSKDFGVPQNRERVFIIGHLRGRGGRKVFPLGETNKIYLGKIANCLDANYHKGWLDHGQRTMVCKGDKGQAYRAYDPDGIAPTLPTPSGGGHIPKAVLTQDRAKKRQNGRRMKEEGEPSFTLTGQDIHGVSDGKRIRRLTPTECCRLQGFSDNWVDGISDTQKYRCLGNAVTVNVIEAIGRKLNEG